MTYSLYEWLFFFYFYCFVGWCWESMYVSIRKKKLVNRGFMRGPLLPIYGFGAIVMLICTLPVRDNIPLTFICGMIGATTLEYFTGAAMEKLFGVRYWDYSNRPLNLNGHIYYGAALLWGLFSVLLVNFIHAPVAAFLHKLNAEAVRVGVFIVTVFASIDFGISFKTALDLKALLKKLTENNEEIRKLKTRTEAIIDSIEDFGAEKKAAFENLVERRSESFKSLASNVSKQYGEKRAEELEELIARYHILRDRINNRKENITFTMGHLVNNNPMVVSKSFSGALDEIKEYLDSRKRKNKNITEENITEKNITE